jgi:hypothetical protein
MGSVSACQARSESYGDFEAHRGRSRGSSLIQVTNDCRVRTPRCRQLLFLITISYLTHLRTCRNGRAALAAILIAMTLATLLRPGRRSPPLPAQDCAIVEPRAVRWALRSAPAGRPGSAGVCLAVRAAFHPGLPHYGRDSRRTPARVKDQNRRQSADFPPRHAVSGRASRSFATRREESRGAAIFWDGCCESRHHMAPGHSDCGTSAAITLGGG